MGRMLAQASIWVLIFLGVVAAFGLWPEIQRALADARLVQYDFSIGKRYSVDRMWPGSLR